MNFELIAPYCLDPKLGATFETKTFLEARTVGDSIPKVEDFTLTCYCVKYHWHLLVSRVNGYLTSGRDTMGYGSV